MPTVGGRMFGLGSGWVSLAGLLLDAAGFSMLAWDLLPEYRANRLARDLDQSAQYAEDAADGVHRPAADDVDPVTITDDLLAQARNESRKLLDHLHWLNVGMAVALLEDVATAVGVRDHPKVGPALKRGVFSRQEHLSAMTVVRRALKSKMAKLAQRRRPPLRLAIGMVIVGFLMQAYGAIPLT